MTMTLISQQLLKPNNIAQQLQGLSSRLSRTFAPYSCNNPLRPPSSASTSSNHSHSTPQKQNAYYYYSSTSSLSSSSSSHNQHHAPTWHGTTILCVRKDGQVCMMGDGQVSMGNMVIKPNATKIRKIYPKTIGGRKQQQPQPQQGDKPGEEKEEGGVIVGFAGSTADAFTLLERLEGKLDEYPGQLARSCVELAKGWRTDKYLRRLEASLLVADENISLEITGNGDVLESQDKVLAVGSGSPFALAAARALQDLEGMSAEEVCRRAMDIASDMCVYTNKCYKFEVMDIQEDSAKKATEEKS
jgi:ATP-dependent protease HslVU, peptidase subunit